MAGIDIMIIIIQTVSIILVAPLFHGIGRMMAARFQSRSGPSGPFQTWRDIKKLFERSETLPGQSSWFFQSAPWMIFAITGVLAAVIPAVATSPSLGMVSDLFVIVYLLALLRFVFGVAAIDTGSPFAGLSAGREQLLSLFVEPTFILSLLVVVILSGGTTNLVEIRHLVESGEINYMTPSFILAAVAFLWAVYAETGKKPYDMAEAEQEVQEGLLSEYSGKRLALCQVAFLVKQCAMAGLFISIFCPWPYVHNPFIALVFFLVKLCIFFILTTYIEHFSSRFTILKIKASAMGAFSISFAALILLIVGRLG